MSRFSLRALSVCTFTLLCSPDARAQVLYGSLTGNVTDPSGGAVPAVKIEALNTGTGVSRAATSDSAGSYSFNDLQPGIYKITFSAPSFRTVVQENVPILANNLRRLDS